MYGIYNVETLEKLVKMVHIIHSRQLLIESLFTGQIVAAYEAYSQMHGTCDIQHYTINSMLYLHTIKDKYIEIYNKFISQLHIYAKAARILAKGYLPILLITPLKLQEILNSVKETLIKMNPDYNIVIKRLHLYYDMKLVTFRIDRKRSLINQFPISVQPYTQQPLIIYQIKTVQVPIVDKNTKADSYMEIKVKKPYIALNSETYINMCQQELATCKRIGYEFYCKELFVVRHKSIHSCESAIYFNLDTDIINENCDFIFHYNKSHVTLTVLNGGNEIILANWPNNKHIICNENCDFIFHYNKSDVTLTVLNGGNEIILANWPNNKHIICTINSGIPIEIPSHPYVLVNRSILCNCRIEAGNNCVLESLATCHDTITKLIMYFTINSAFINDLNEFNLMEKLEVPILTNRSTSEITLPVFLKKSTFDNMLLSAPLILKEYITQYKCDKENSDLKERHDIDELEIEFASKNFFTNNFIIDIFIFVTAIISVI